jgi:hypothetical protein
MEDWFRWILGILNGVYLLVIGWILTWIGGLQKEMSGLDYYS